MKISKKYIILGVVFIVYISVMFIFFGDDYIRNNIDKGNIILSPGSVWKFEKGKWVDVDNNAEYSMKTYKVYEKNKFIGDYQLTYNQKLYLFDENRVPVNYEYDLIATKGTIDIGVIPFEEEYISSSDSIVQKILKEKQIKASSNTITARVIKVDLNNDNRVEEIYVISNVFEADEYSNSFSVIAVRENNKIKYLKDEVRDGIYTLDMCNPYIQNIIDIDKDNKYEIISACTYYSDGDTCHMLYDSNYKVIKNC